jgi:hypothetical protein
MNKRSARDQLDPDERDRLWSHREQIDHAFHSLANFFAVAEAILLAAVSNLVGKAELGYLAGGLTGFGLLLSVVWWLVQVKQHRILEDLKGRCRQNLREYRTTRTARSTTGDRFPYSNTRLLTHSVPLTFLAIWVAVAVTISFR